MNEILNFILFSHLAARKLLYKTKASILARRRSFGSKHTTRAIGAALKNCTGGITWVRQDVMFFGLLLSPAYDSIIKSTQDKKLHSTAQSACVNFKRTSFIDSTTCDANYKFAMSILYNCKLRVSCEISICFDIFSFFY